MNKLKIVHVMFFIFVSLQLFYACNMYEPNGKVDKGILAGDPTGSAGQNEETTIDMDQIASISIESKSDGSGTVVNNITLPRHASQRVYAIGRDSYGGFISLVKVTWGVGNAALINSVFIKSNMTILYASETNVGVTTVTATHSSLSVTPASISITIVASESVPTKIGICTTIAAGACTSANELTEFDAGTPVYITLTAQDDYGNTITSLDFDYPLPDDAEENIYMYIRSGLTNIRPIASNITIDTVTPDAATTYDSSTGYLSLRFDNGVSTFRLTYTLEDTLTLRLKNLSSEDSGYSELNTTEYKVLTFNPGGLSKFVISGIGTSLVAGTNYNITVSATDVSDNAISDYNGTIHFSVADGVGNVIANNDSTEPVPDDYTFTASDYGTRTLSGVRFTRSSYTNVASGGNANYIISVTDVANGVTTTSSNFTVTHAPINSFTATLTELPPFPIGTNRGTGTYSTTSATNIYSNEKFALQITAIDKFSNAIDDFTGTVAVTTSGTNATLPNNYTFVDADNGIHNYTITDNTALILRTTQTIGFEAQAVTITSTGTTGTFSMNVYPTSCPEGQILAPARTDTDTEKFCVSKYEMKSSGGTFVSEASGTPALATASDAFDACDSVNDENAVNEIARYRNGKYGLISNAEWMAIAKNIETGYQGGSGVNKSGNNWYNHMTVYTGQSFMKGIGVAPYAASNNDNSGYTNTGSTDGLPRRTLYITDTTSSSVIWDFAGNAAEWLDYDTTDEVFTAPQGFCMGGNSGPLIADGIHLDPPIFDFTALSDTIKCGSIEEEMLAPITDGFSTAEGMGTWSGSRYNVTGPIVRGGSYDTNATAGINVVGPSSSVYHIGGASVTTAELGIKLTSQPKGEITITVSTASANITIDTGATLTFNSQSWNSEQIVKITGAGAIAGSGSDAVSINPSSTIDTRYNTLATSNVNIPWVDAAVGSIIAEVTDRTSGEDGTTAKIRVRLPTNSGSEETLSITTSVANEITLSASTLTFTTSNYDTYQEITITGVNDTYYDGDVTVPITITNTDATFNPVTVNVINRDNEPLVQSEASGIYHFSVDNSEDDTHGFRCVFRPQDDYFNLQ